jgi:hypothetical protein
MLRLAAAHLAEQMASNRLAGHPEKKLVWVDIGGGTGEISDISLLDIVLMSARIQAPTSKRWTSSSGSITSMPSS